MSVARVVDASSAPQPCEAVAPGAASWLCAGGRWDEHGEFPGRGQPGLAVGPLPFQSAVATRSAAAPSQWAGRRPEPFVDADEKRGLLSGLDGELPDHQEADLPRPTRLPVASDCFALVLVAEELSSPGTLLIIPLVCVLGQCTVLIFMATTNEYAFREGVWLTPRSDHASLMAMRLVGLMLSLLKASGEFANTLALFQALSLGASVRPPERGVRWAASMALVLQYLMALAVVFTCTQIVIAETSPIYALLKVLSAWVVVDMDNYIAQYLVEVLDWRHITWSVPLAPDLSCRRWNAPLRTVPAGQAPLQQMSLSAWRSLRPEQGGEQPHIPRSKAARMVFFGVPAALVLMEVGLAIALDVLPFTYLSRGFVSNRDAPVLLGKGAGLPDGCCPPVLQSLGHGRGWSFSVLLLVPRSARGADAEPAAPQLSWVAVADTAAQPTSLQVIDGLNGDGVPAVQAGGGVSAKRTQAYWWLLMQHYGHEGTDRIFQALLSQRGLGLYKTHLPYTANFTVLDELASLGSYRIFVAAQNPETLALSPEPVFSSPLHTFGCPPGCLQCGGHLSRCFKCSEGRHWSPLKGVCAACAKGCSRCDASGDGLCDLGACKHGFGLTEAGVCAECNITGCSVCDRRRPVRAAPQPVLRDADQLLRPPEGPPIQAEPRVCDACAQGFGLVPGRQRCQPCGPHCEHCHAASASEAPEEENNETGGAVAANCTACARGFGLVQRAEGPWPGRSACVACRPHCRRCRGPPECLECTPGFAPGGRGGCAACAAGCQSCTRSGPGRCDEGGCRPGYGYNQGSCRLCELAHCTVCNFTHEEGLFAAPAREICSRCGEGYGRTEDGACEDCGESCLRCDQAGACEVCLPGYTTDHDPRREGGGRCQACGDRCERCGRAGPARCDKCISGYELDAETHTCLPITRAAANEI